MALIIDKFGFDIVHGCQLRCVGCPNSTLKPTIKYISPDFFNKCLNNIDVDYIRLMRLFNFGEPLLHPQLPEILKIISLQTWKVKIVEISTNAQYHDFDILTKALQTGVINRIAVSCDGNGTPEDYERLRPPGKWSKLIEFLKEVKSLRDKYAPNVSLITRTICENIPDQQRWNGVLFPLGWTPEFRSWLTLPEASQNLSNQTVIFKTDVCDFMKRTNLYVSCDGEVLPCCVHPKPFILGNLDTETYTQIMSGITRKNKLLEMQNNRADMNICSQCVF